MTTFLLKFALSSTPCKSFAIAQRHAGTSAVSSHFSVALLHRHTTNPLLIRNVLSSAKRLLISSAKRPPKLAAFGRSLRLLGLSLCLAPNLVRAAKCQQNGRAQATGRMAVQQRTAPAVSWAEFWGLVRPYFGWLLFAALAAAVVAALNIQIPVLLGQLVNHISGFLARGPDAPPAAGIDFAGLKPIAGRLVLAYVGQAAATFLCIASLSWMGERMSADLRVRLFAHLLNFPMPFFDHERSGELSDRLNYDVQEFKSCFKSCSIQGLRTLAQTVGCLLSLYLMSPQMTLLTAAIVPAVVAVGALFGALLRRLSFRAQQQSGLAAGVAAEAFQNIRTVKVMAMEEAEISLYHQQVAHSRELNEQLGLGIGAFQALSNLFLNGLVLAVLYSGGQLVAAQSLSPGDLMSFLATSQTIQRSLAQLSMVFGNGVKAWASCARIMEFLRVEPVYARGGTQRIPWHSLVGQIELRGVHFAYPTRPDQPVLQGLDLHIGGGQTVAICGPSGAGKSTVAALIEGLYEPQAGLLTLDGVDVGQLDAKWLRRNAIGVISQEPLLFSTSIRENIRYGKPEATEAEIREAARLANASEFIEQFPLGYDTPVGERGLSLSGGQKQRIAIARALIKNPPILLLDEATSALDTESERLVQQALARVMRDRTVVIIAHRLSTIRNADCICVIKDGRVVERGSHDQLIRNRNGLYYGLVREQQDVKTETMEATGGA